MEQRRPGVTRANAWLVGIVLLGAALLAPPCHAAANDLAAAARTFFAHADYGAVKLSPSGKYVAALVPVQGRLRLALIDLDARTSKVVVSMEGDDIAEFEWVNDDRFVYTVGDLQAGLGEQRGGGLFAINRDGTEYRELAPTLQQQAGQARFVYRGTALLRTLPEGGDDVLVLANATNPRYPDVYRLNTKTGRRTLVSVGKPGDVVHWVADRAGNVRGAVAVEKGTITKAFWRATADGPWLELGTYAMREPQTLPVDFDADGTMIVASDVGRDTAALYRYDGEHRKLGDLLAAHPNADLGPPLVHDDRGRIVGMQYDAEQPGAAWFDVEWARLQKTVDTALPGRANVLTRHGSRVLVNSYSDTDPGTYYLLDLDKRRLEPLAIRRKAIDPAVMPHREAVRYKARDGLEIPAYLTLPKGKENAKGLPLVMYVHGGPWVRGGHWRWNPEAAFLASLGFAVLEPEFRGSRQWGRKLYLAGWKQWGLAMQDDLDDGMDWLAARGTIDPKRACIMGASYGGYAVMMGLARDPDRYRCGVNYVGVTDINLMFDVTWSDFANTDFLRYGAKELIGDPSADAEQLRKTSPLGNADRITKPVLMAYGAQDHRVPLVHGERMRDALRAHGTPVEWIVYNEEGHGFLLQENRFDFYARVGAFLLRELKP